MSELSSPNTTRPGTTLGNVDAGDRAIGTKHDAPMVGGIEHAHGDSHGNHGLVAHHFAELEQQREAGTLGMWFFLCTEVLFIGAIFVGYFAYRNDPRYFEAFRQGSDELVTWIGAVNTAVLLTSSLTVVLAIRACQQNKQKQIFWWLALTILFGAMFFGFKIVEYTVDYNEHLWPGGRSYFHPKHMTDPVMIDHAKLFYRFYYSLTGLHAFHMLVGLGIFFYLLVKAKMGKFTPQSHQEVEICGLYWHFVDLVWIFLFPLLYLVR